MAVVYGSEEYNQRSLHNMGRIYGKNVVSRISLYDLHIRSKLLQAYHKLYGNSILRSHLLLIGRYSSNEEDLNTDGE